MATLVVAQEEAPEAERLLLDLVAQVGLTTAVLAINDRPSKTAQSRLYRILAGPGFIRERLGTREFQVYADTFFQTNTRMAEHLLHEARNACAPGNWKRLLDLYCGVGSLILNLNDQAEQCLGVEIVDSAIQSGRELAKSAGVTNVSFMAGEVAKSLRELHESGATADLMVVDPPRAGLNPK